MDSRVHNDHNGGLLVVPQSWLFLIHAVPDTSAPRYFLAFDWEGILIWTVQSGPTEVQT